MTGTPRNLILTHDDYTVGWVSALEDELSAAIVMLDERHPGLWAADPQDSNTYVLGRIGDHNIVMACLPSGVTGKVSAATVAKDMVRSFPAIRFGLMVGIGGGAPYYGARGDDNGMGEEEVGNSESSDTSDDDEEDMGIRDIRLGDVVVSVPSKSWGAVVQYDFGKSVQGGGFIHIGGQLNKPPSILLSAISLLRADQDGQGNLDKILEQVMLDHPRLAQRKFRYPGSQEDYLFNSEFAHMVGNTNCKACRCVEGNIMKRKNRPDNSPRLHYGTIGSADQVMKDALLRDKWAEKEGIICFEMEAAGLMDSFPCVVIRGISDYADSHKNKKWQKYAALTAACYAKQLLQVIPGQGVLRMTPIKQLEESIREVHSVVQNTSAALNTRHQEEESQAILSWLAARNHTSQQHDILAQKQEGTGAWFLGSEEFASWVEHPDQILYCPGVPGAGKTIMAAVVVDHLLGLYQTDNLIAIGYFYCNFQRQDEQRPVDLIATLLQQLSLGRDSIPGAVKDLYNQHKPRQTRPSLEDLRKTLYSVASTYRRTFIVIDALDECQTAPDARGSFLNEIIDLQAKGRANIFTTSRFDASVESMFVNAVQLEIRAHDTDIERYLHAKLQDCSSLISRDESIQEQIRNTVAKAVDGMFLLARLYIETLASKTTPKAIKTALRELEYMLNGASSNAQSKTLDHAYEQAMRRVQSQVEEHRSLAQRVLSWISCASGNLTSAELQHAIAVENGASQLDPDNITPVDLIVVVCAGLVVVDKESNIVRLMHYTTQEYFDRESTRWFPDVHADLTRTCVTYLSYECFESGSSASRKIFKDRLQLYALYSYASLNWGYHARNSSSKVRNPVMELLTSTTKISASSQALLYDEDELFFESETGMTGIHVAAAFGLFQETSTLLDMGYNIDSRDVLDRVPLFWAVKNGHEAVSELLIRRDAHVDSQDFNGSTPLLEAVENGHEAIVMLLLEANVDLEYSHCAIIGAAENGHEEVMKLLLERNANVESRNRVGYTPLFLAVMKGHTEKGNEEVVKLLLEKGANKEAKNYLGQTSLSLSAEKGYDAVVKLLLDSGRTPLLVFAACGYQKAVRLLLDRNAIYLTQLLDWPQGSNAATGRGGSPFMRAK
ncbi:hypothetical protein BJY04DRAFT_233110 [Aspergillus karnatakaensis]|uniref:uncharacterized protein n=1 Tax=Aspergillus karnatakaensis TaxID=1810916 RepID=UPI003CCE19EE